MDKTAKWGLTALAAVVVVGVLVLGITAVANIQNDRDDVVRCAISDC